MLKTSWLQQWMNFRIQPVFHSSSCYRWFCHLTWCSSNSEVWSGLPQLSHLKNPLALSPVRWLCQISTGVEAETKSFHQRRGQETLRRRSHGKRWGGQLLELLRFFLTSWNHFMLERTFWWFMDVFTGKTLEKNFRYCWMFMHLWVSWEKTLEKREVLFDFHSLAAQDEEASSPKVSPTEPTAASRGPTDLPEVDNQQSAPLPKGHLRSFMRRLQQRVRSHQSSWVAKLISFFFFFYQVDVAIFSHIFVVDLDWSMECWEMLGIGHSAILLNGLTYSSGHGAVFRLPRTGEVTELSMNWCCLDPWGDLTDGVSGFQWVLSRNLGFWWKGREQTFVCCFLFFPEISTNPSFTIRWLQIVLISFPVVTPIFWPSYHRLSIGTGLPPCPGVDLASCKLRRQ